jgi:hypothetical protein
MSWSVIGVEEGAQGMKGSHSHRRRIGTRHARAERQDVTDGVRALTWFAVATTFALAIVALLFG